jgi:hypothetical protein
MGPARRLDLWRSAARGYFKSHFFFFFDDFFALLFLRVLPDPDRRFGGGGGEPCGPALLPFGTADAPQSTRRREVVRRPTSCSVSRQVTHIHDAPLVVRLRSGAARFASALSGIPR